MQHGACRELGSLTSFVSQLSDHVKRIEAVEAKIEHFAKEHASKVDVKKLRADTKMVYVSSHSLIIMDRLMLTP